MIIMLGWWIENSGLRYLYHGCNWTDQT